MVEIEGWRKGKSRKRGSPPPPFFFFLSTRESSERRHEKHETIFFPHSPDAQNLKKKKKKKHYPQQQAQSHHQRWRAEYKARVKKLQRFRDQARAWQADAESKSAEVCAPASAFTDLRRAIEGEMERCALFESAHKKRDFSNVALEAAARADALEAAEAAAAAATEAMSPSGDEPAAAEHSPFSFSSASAPDERLIGGRTKTTLLAAVLGGRHGETPQERARRRSCKWIVAAQAS